MSRAGRVAPGIAAIAKSVYNERPSGADGADVARTFPDIVVVIPGLIGSVLSKNGEAIWGTSPGALWRVVAGNALEKLELGGADNEEDDLGDGIVPTSLVE